MKDFFEKISRRPTAAALVFALSLAGCEAFAFGQNYAEAFGSFSTIDLTSARTIFFHLFSFGVLTFFTRSMLVSSFRWKCIYFAVFAFAVAVEYGFQTALGRFTLPSDAENVFFVSDGSEKIGAVTLFFNWFALLPIAVFRALFYLSKTGASNGLKLFAANALVVFSGFALAADFNRPPAPTNSLAAHLNNLTVSAIYFAIEKRARKPREAVAPVENARPQNNVVFIVDESVRADRLSLNGYERDTTPTLRRLARENLLKNWGAGASGATESVGSNRLLLSGVNDLPDRERCIYTAPTVFQYARAAGYKTFYFDGQNYAEWIGSEADKAGFGAVVGARDFPGVAPVDLDAAFALKIREIVGNSGGNFIWVNKRGVHFRYENNYPQERRVWSPIDADALAAAESNPNRPLENNYDNAVLYNSESFFAALFAGGVPTATDFIYTSDHGQTLIKGAAAHAGGSRNEALVPIFIVSTDERVRNADAGFAAAHENLFATLLDLFDYPVRLREREYARSLLAAKRADFKPRTYFVGNVTGAFGGKKMSFDR